MPYQGASMNHENIQRIIFYILILLLSGCFGTLAKKTMQINLGDDKETVTNAMGLQRIANLEEQTKLGNTAKQMLVFPTMTIE